MSQKASTIELNGKRYDSVTGKFLGVSGTTQPANPDSPERSPEPEKSLEPEVRPRFTASHAQRTSVHHAARHRPQHATTLMRQVVGPPGKSLKRHLKPVSHTASLIVQPSLAITPKRSVSVVDENRLKRAEQTAKSRLISRFGSIGFHLTQPQPVLQLATASGIQPSLATNQGLLTREPAAHQPSHDIFERALQHANAHTQPTYKVTRHKRAGNVRHTTGVVGSLVIVVLILSFIAYSNVPALQLKIATATSGINATLPKWYPLGYALNKLSFGPGSVVANFTSHNTSSSFTLSQVASNWDSSTLLSNFVLPSGGISDTLLTSGGTIYTYGNNDATWVKNGVWYKLATNGALSTSELVQVASSM